MNVDGGPPDDGVAIGLRSDTPAQPLEAIRSTAARALGRMIEGTAAMPGGRAAAWLSFASIRVIRVQAVRAGPSPGTSIVSRSWCRSSSTRLWRAGDHWRKEKRDDANYAHGRELIQVATRAKRARAATFSN
jgi:hypothetical protein